MPWAARRRLVYLSGLVLFFLVVIGGPIVYHFATIKPTCFDGIQNQGETAPDRGGPCLILDERYLTPYAIEWARSFKVRDGSYTAVAYINNPNPSAGVALVHYTFGLYDSQNVLVAQRQGQTYIMPDGITPVLETGIDTGNRVVVHTYLKIDDSSLTWERMTSPASVITVNDQQVSGADTLPRVSAQANNASYDTLRNVLFVAVAFDPAGNAIAASRTALPQLDPTAAVPIAFTWPEPFSGPVGRIDITPLMQPAPAPPSGSSGS